MRQGQQNRRGRGRNNGNGQGRKGQNPLTRSFESAGPDVKLRGTPAHIAEKYVALARDAQSGGDPVLAENYLQHAEHYNRIIMTYREQQVAQNGGDVQSSQMSRHRVGGADAGQPGAVEEPPVEEDRGEDAAIAADSDAADAVQGSAPAGRSRSGHDRGARRGGHRGDRSMQRASRGNDSADAKVADAGDDNAAAPRREREQRSQGLAHHEQPEFLRRPVRRSRRDGANGNGTQPSASGDAPSAEFASSPAAVDSSSE